MPEPNTHAHTVLTACSLYFTHVSPSRPHCASVYRQTSFHQSAHQCISEPRFQFFVKTQGAAAVPAALAVLEMKQERHALPTQGRRMENICKDTSSVIQYQDYIHTQL